MCHRRPIGAGLAFGRLDAARLARLADLAEELRLTPWRAILLTGPRLDREMSDALAASGFILDADDPLRAVAACPGAPACPRGSTATQLDAAAFAPWARAHKPSGITLHVSGCAKGCAHNGAAAVTLVGRGGKYDVVRNGRASDAPLLTGVAAAELATVLAA